MVELVFLVFFIVDRISEDAFLHSLNVFFKR